MIVWLKRARWAALGLASIAACSCSFHHTKYENPVTKDTQQPDKLLYDKAIKDLQRGRYEMARLTLNTLINTYDTSEYLAKAKLAIADSWFNEGGVSGFAQAEQEYKDFELYFPTMPEASEAQYKICKGHMAQMSKPDRDTNQALRAEQECKQLVLQYPNSKFVPEAEQDLRNIDEALAEGEMRVGNLYYSKGSHASAANRFAGLVDQYPLYSRADEALWKEADSYLGMGARLRPNAVLALQKIVRDYPLSAYADPAKKKLHDLEAEVPAADPAALARMKYEEENRTKTSTFHNMTEFLRPGPDTTMAAKSGAPAMNPPKQLIPANVPPATGATAAAGFNGDVTVSPATSTAPPVSTANITTATDPANVPKADAAANAKDTGKKKNDKKNNKKKQQDQATAPAATPATAAQPDQAPAAASAPASTPDQSQTPSAKP
jgi:outer membrane protein assembly factor BamD